MINFRYHVVSIVSVFLALAVGVALGGGPLKGEVDNTLVDQVKADRQAKADFRAEIASLRGTNAFSDSFATTVAPKLIANTLKGRVVSLVVLPGAEQATVGSLSELVTQAGGTVGGTVRVGDGLLDVGNKQLVDELGTQLIDGVSDVEVSDDASGYQRLGALLARAIGTDEDAGAVVDDTANGILSGFSTASLLSAEGDLTRRGSLVLVVTGNGSGSAEERQGTNSILTAVVQAVDERTDGVVVTGPVASAREGGVVAAIRDDVVVARDVSTVDTLDRTAGEVVTLMALAGQAAGDSGHYGAVDAADGAMPGATSAAQ